jgi:hypothetical protein
VKTVDQATILAAGDSGPQGLAVTFDVYDMVENHSEDWSAEIRLVVDTDSTRLGALIVREAQSNVLDLDVLGDKPVTASILTPSGGVFEINDEIVVTVKGTTTEGVPVNISCDAKTIEDLDDIVDVLVPNTSIRALAKTQAIFSYSLIKKDGSPDLLSKGRFVSVIGEVQRLAAPIAKDASQGSIDPELQRTTVEILWDDAMQAGQVIDLKWLGIYPNLDPYFPALEPHLISNNEAVAKQSIFIGVDGVHLAKISGGTLELYYELLSDVKTRTLVTRQSLHAAVLSVGEPKAELPAPTVLHAEDGVLDPEGVPSEGTRLIVPMYNGIISGDEVHYQWTGSTTGVATDWIKLNSITDKKPVPFDILKQLVVDNLGGTVEASYYVVRTDGRTSVSDVLTLQIGKEAGEAPIITSVTDSKGVEVPDGSSTFDTTVTLKGKAAANQKVQILDGTTSKGEATVNASGDWTLQLTGLSRASHRITAKGLYDSNPVSAARTFSVATATVPTITNVIDSKGEVPNNDTTFDTTVTLKGKAAANQKVQILDGTTSKGEATVNASGDWTLQLTGLSVASHRITAKGLYENQPTSPTRMFTVAKYLAHEDFHTVPAQDIPAGGSVNTPHMLIGALTNGIKISASADNRYLWVEGRVELYLKVPCSTASFYYGLSRSGEFPRLKFECLNASGTVIYQQDFMPDRHGEMVLHHLNPPQQMYRIRIESIAAAVQFDDFTLRG